MFPILPFNVLPLLVPFTVTKHPINTDWENYIPKYNTNASLNILNYNKEQIIDILGNPNTVVQKKSKTIINEKNEEILIFRPDSCEYNKGTNAVTIYVTNEKITDYIVDCFIGFDLNILPSYFN